MTVEASNLSTAISLPQGGGAIHGIGETFKPSLFSGTGNFTVPIATSPGRDGFGPELALRYSSGNGNGSFGLGWSLQLPSITRKTEKGLPRYTQEDVFVLAGGEDLVPRVDQASGDVLQFDRQLPASAGSPAVHFRVTRYSPRTETSFARIEHWEDLHRGDSHWRVTTRNNVTSVYGRTSEARVAHPNDANQIFEWLLQESFDVRGNHVLYEYARDDQQLLLSEVYEQRRQYLQRYLRRIYYGNLPTDSNAQPLTYDGVQPIGPEREGLDHLDPLALKNRRYGFEVVFDYGDWMSPSPVHSDDPLPDSPHPDPPSAGEQELFGADQPIRPDRSSSFRAGFEIRNLRRCQRVLMFHHFLELEQPTLVKSTDFDYVVDAQSKLSLLRAVSAVGYRKTDNGYVHRRMPPVEFEYSLFQPNSQRFESLSVPETDYPPFSLGNSNMALVDLFGDGTPDIVMTENGEWHYWRNLGNGSLQSRHVFHDGPQQLELADAGVMLADTVGNGIADLLVLNDSAKGFFAGDGEGGWSQSSFQPFQSVPTQLLSSNARRIDLTGDGRTDLLESTNDYFVWFPSKGSSGFGLPEFVPKIHDEDEFPDVFLNDPSGRIRIADMTGDGLADIVSLRGRRVEYWPNLGYGRFGTKIVMGGLPDFDDNSDPSRVFLVDLDGSGAADIVLVEHDSVRFWINQSGNTWSQPSEIHGTPLVTDATGIRFADFYGKGTSCLIFSEDFANQPNGNFRILDFCGGIKPFLVTEMSNNLGMTTRVEYTTSSACFHEDENAGLPWITRVPFPVQVVSKVESIDHIGRTKLVTRYRYHHGYYDGHEREFRGFGRVDQIDTEFFEGFSTPGLHDWSETFDNAQRNFHVPPVETRTWFHTGFYLETGPQLAAVPVDHRELAARYREEYYHGDLEAFELEKHEFETGGSPQSAYRALRGATLRKEIYSNDGSDHQFHPYSTTEFRYQIKNIQHPIDQRRGIFAVFPKEKLAYRYERNPVDPRVSHEIVVEVDSFGNVVKQLTLAYGRRISVGFAEQQKPHFRLDWNSYINEDSQIDYYYAGLACESRSFEIVGQPPNWNGTRLLREADFDDLIHDPGNFSHSEQQPVGFVKRLLKWRQEYYRKDEALQSLDDPDDYTHRLPLGQVARLGLHYESYQAALTEGLRSSIYGDRVNDVDRSQGGYLASSQLDSTHPNWPSQPGVDEYWWVPSGKQSFGGQFLQTVAAQDPFGNVHRQTHDLYGLLVQQTQDPLGNIVRAKFDFRVLQPIEMSDPNGVITAAVFDTLGFVAATAIYKEWIGDDGATQRVGDSLVGLEPDLSPIQIEQFFTSPSTEAGPTLNQATTRFVYDYHRFRQDKILGHAPPRPNWICSLARSEHASESSAASISIQKSIGYFDGLGRMIQTKTFAETHSGDAQEVSEKWVGSGWNIYNNKGASVQAFEPFFSSDHQFEENRRNGVSPTIFYDPLGRRICAVNPNHSYEKIVFDPWRRTIWDANDTVLLSPTGDPDVGAQVAGFIETIPGFQTWFDQRVADSDNLPQVSIQAPAQQDAAVKSAAHANTPTVFHMDSIGRDFLSINNSGTESIDVRMELDIEGRDLRVVDPRGIAMFEHKFDMLDRKLVVDSQDAGKRLVFLNVVDNPLLAWDSRGYRTRASYDPLQRSIENWVKKPTGPESLVGKTVYGESLTPTGSQNDVAAIHHHRTRVYQTFDSAGTVTFVAYDFKGNVTKSTRQIATQFEGTIDWNTSVPLGETLETTQRTDALGNVVEHVAPDQSRTVNEFDTRGMLKRVKVYLNGASNPTNFVTDIEYNEKGQRTTVTLGNGLTTTYEYEQDTYRLSGIETHSTSRLFQQLTYTYDPIGNITRIHDGTFQSVFHAGQQIDAASNYVYDGVYRLTEVRGREHISMGACTHREQKSQYSNFCQLGAQSVNNSHALRNYTRRYQYDLSSNLTSITHQAGASASWTRQQTYATDSNRLLNSDAGCDGESGSVLAHDENGNLLETPGAGQMQWDHGNRLTKITTRFLTHSTPDTAHYVYDASGMRVRKVIKRGQRISEERVYYGNYEIYREFDANGDVKLERTTLKVLDNQEVVALVNRRTQGAEPGQAATTTRYQLSNHLGSSVMEVDEHGNPISYEEFYPYGGTSYIAGESWNKVKSKRYRYSGKEKDSESGLYYFGARYFAPWLGRWMSPDPLGMVDGLNLFAFVQGNPIRLRDPSGTESTEINFEEGTEIKGSTNVDDLKDTTLSAMTEARRNGDHEMAEYYKDEWLRIVREDDNLDKAAAGIVAGAIALPFVIAGSVYYGAPVLATAGRNAMANTVESVAIARTAVKIRSLGYGLTAGETLADLGNVTLSGLEMVFNPSVAAANGMALALGDLATGPNPAGDANSALVMARISRALGGGGRKPIKSVSELVQYAKANGLPLGGRYGDLKDPKKGWGGRLKELGLEVHHLPSKKAEPGMNENDFPALLMLKGDHKLTESFARKTTTATEERLPNFKTKFERAAGEIEAGGTRVGKDGNVVSFSGDYKRGLQQAWNYFMSRRW